MLQAGQRHEDAGEMKQPAGFQMLMFGVHLLSDCDLCPRLNLTIIDRSVPDRLLCLISRNYLFILMTCPVCLLVLSYSSQTRMLNEGLTFLFLVLDLWSLSVWRLSIFAFPALWQLIWLGSCKIATHSNESNSIDFPQGSIFYLI